MIKRGDWTPWGPAQTVHEHAPGIYRVTTAGHGGFRLSPEVLAKVPATYLEPSAFYLEGSPWFEEDCEAARVVLSFSALFSELQVRAAGETWDQMHPRHARGVRD